jgi:predicted component of type VI protein secretion system
MVGYNPPHVVRGLSQSMSARVLFRDAQGRDGAVDLGDEPVYIGRAVECAIRTDDAMVSRRHSLVRFDQGKYWVEDLGSSNGTHVNDVRVQKQLLSHNDVVRCGSLWLRYIEVTPALPATVLPGPVVVQSEPVAPRFDPPARRTLPPGAPRLSVPAKPRTLPPSDAALREVRPAAMAASAVAPPLRVVPERRPEAAAAPAVAASPALGAMEDPRTALEAARLREEALGREVERLKRRVKALSGELDNAQGELNKLRMGAPSGDGSAESATLRRRALYVYQTINQTLSELRVNALVARDELRQIVSGDTSADRMAILMDAVASMIQETEDSKTALRTLSELSDPQK